MLNSLELPPSSKTSMRMQDRCVSSGMQPEVNVALPHPIGSVYPSTSTLLSLRKVITEQPPNESIAVRWGINRKPSHTCQRTQGQDSSAWGLATEHNRLATSQRLRCGVFDPIASCQRLGETSTTILPFFRYCRKRRGFNDGTTCIRW